MMNINSVSNLFTTESDRTIKKELDKEAFLQILTTQLKNQDPLEPMKDQDFIAQMSQLSSVEQIMNMSKSVQTFVDTASQLYRTQSVSMIGKTAVVKTNTVDVSDGTPETKISILIPMQTSLCRYTMRVERSLGRKDLDS